MDKEIERQVDAEKEKRKKVKGKKTHQTDVET
jgi:hypothetical protein